MHHEGLKGGSYTPKTSNLSVLHHGLFSFWGGGLKWYTRISGFPYFSGRSNNVDTLVSILIQ